MESTSSRTPSPSKPLLRDVPDVVSDPSVFLTHTGLLRIPPTSSTRLS
ncbi:hypothetical protein L5515_012338 [Caenorhabditis briggsae]|uniref:Uncharacterized protein n=1 Tax=Caenorhabditis briggsae TaxID=6238 RepID=A0AAE9EX68_CAEBR|nr:hypothetical protein L5515_012338 [Caenorhabditis briggsae]